MGSALLFFTSSSGHGQFAKKKTQIVERLQRLFDPLEIYESKTKEDGVAKLTEAMDAFDAIVIVGGDGTFHTAVGIAAKAKRSPVLGYINNGTLGDVGRSYGVTSSWKKALRIIEEGYVVPSDAVDADGEVFAYMGACGAYSAISYDTKRKRKKRFHRFAYYFASIREAFTPHSIHYQILANGKEYEGTSPFLLILNGAYVGGFPINRNGSFCDGKAELYITPKGPFNGLLHYFFAKKKIQRIEFSEATIRLNGDIPWCFDGERSKSGDVTLKVLPSAVKIFADKKAVGKRK